MTCSEARLKASALIDDEVDERDIAPLVSHLESCYRCRNTYIELLKTQRRLSGIRIPEPSGAWYEELPWRIGRTVLARIGRIGFIGSYVLLGAYAIYRLYASSEVTLAVKLIIGALVVGFCILLTVSIADRIRERKDDPYKHVMH